MNYDIVECSFDKHDIRSLVSLAADQLVYWTKQEKFQEWVRNVLEVEEPESDSFDFNETWWIYRCEYDRPLFTIGFTLGNVGFGVALVEIEL